MKTGTRQSTNQITVAHTYETVDESGQNYDVINGHNDIGENHIYNVLEQNGRSCDSHLTQDNAIPQEYLVPQLNS